MEQRLVFLFTAFFAAIEGFKSQASVRRITICPAGETNSTCASLEDHIFNKGENFVSNTDVVFVAGTHRLSGVLVITDVSNLSLSADWSLRGTVRCDGHGGLVFKRSTNITIGNLNFTSCGVNTLQHTNSPFAAAISLEKVVRVTVEYVNILTTTGYGIIGAKISGRVTIRHSTFWDNKVYKYSGGHVRLSFEECSAEVNNSLLVQYTEFVNGSTEMQNASGLIVDCMCPGVTIHLDHATANGNKGGNVQLEVKDYDAYNWEILVSHSIFTGGNGSKGSGLYFSSQPGQQFCNYTSTIQSGSSVMIVNTRFESNTAKEFGGGFMAQLYDSDCKPANITLINCTFVDNRVTDSNGQGAAVVAVQMSAVPQFFKRLVPLHQIQFRNGRFSNNAVEESDASVVQFKNIEKATIQDCFFADNSGSAIAMTASQVSFTGNITFDNNTGTNGGALQFYDSSVMFLYPNTLVTFKNNIAKQVGGAVFAQDTHLVEPRACFFQPVVEDDISIKNLSTYQRIALILTNNAAGVAGDAIYGGKIDKCRTFARLRNSEGNLSHYLSSAVFNATFNFDGQGSKAVSSEPYKVEFCADSELPASQETNTDWIMLFPGKEFQVNVTAVGQRAGTAPATVELTLNNPNFTITPALHSTLTNGCTSVTATVRTIHVNATLILTVKVRKSSVQSQQCSNDSYKKKLHVESCPWGFFLNKSEGSCDCLAKLVSSATYECDLDTLTVRVLGSYIKNPWIGCLNGSTESANFGLAYAYDCGRQEYCNFERHILPAQCTDNLCADNRTGILCGSCKPGWSVVLGSGKCKSCPPSNKFLSLVVLHLATGILLIVIITKCRLTITDGSLNGLIFYANFMHWNRNTLFLHFHNGDIFRLIIAWLNLDLGIEVCFYNGMTALHVMWLQVGYILYIVILQASIIMLCRRYVIFTRFFGRNITKVLSTLVTLLYAKTMVTVASVFIYTDIYIHNGTSNNHTSRVLSEDGNIRFGSPQHIPLLVMASLLAFVLVLFTSNLLFIRILTRISGQRFFKWVARFRPFFETITGACNFNYTFWPGFLFLMRLLYVMALTFQHDHHFLDRTTAIATLIIILSFLSPKGVYKKWSINIMELSLILNLAITSLLVNTSFRHKHTTDVTLITRVSVSTAFLTVFTYHVHTYIRPNRLKKTATACIRYILAKCSKPLTVAPPLTTHTDVSVGGCVQAERTPLLPAQVMPPVIEYDMVREPLLEK
jgi:hypothetical protein